MPTNLYGPGDNYHLENSHVIPAMIRKFHLAKLATEGDLAGIIRNEEIYGPIPQDVQKAIGYSSANRKLQTANSSPKVMLWGTGQVYREFLHVDDMASACIFTMNLDQSVFTNSSTLTLHPSPSFLNVGIGKDQTIAETASLIQEVVNFKGETTFDSSKPDGTPKKLLDTTRINTLGWHPRFNLREGLQNSYEWYLQSNKISNSKHIG